MWVLLVARRHHLWTYSVYKNGEKKSTSHGTGVMFILASRYFRYQAESHYLFLKSPPHARRTIAIIRFQH